jgi:transglutaminase-like putative cysteine protease
MLLDDHQIRVTDSTVERYTRHTQLIAIQKDLEEAGQVEIEFEPSYQTLTIHFIQIRRGQSVIDALRPTEIRVLHREEELEQQIFNGTVQALAILHDLRVGDVVDIAYTVTGQNPVMGGKYAGVIPLDFYRPVKFFRYRLIFPSKRKISMRSVNTGLEPKITAGEQTEYLWVRHDIPALPDDDGVPRWYYRGSRVDISEFPTWPDVVEWALPLYRPGKLSRDLSARIEAIKMSSRAPQDRVIAALRLVQDDVRYLGIEMGPYSHLPTAPSKVLERRFGDCKDKALLLTTILRELGIDAAPALVDTESGKELDKHQPSPYAFDHVIVQVRLDGKTYWLDGTDSFQRGTLDRFYNPPFGKALVLRDQTTSLEDITLSVPSSPTVLVTEHYGVPDTNSPVTFQVVTKYSGKSADDFRYYFAGTTLEKLSESYLNYYADHNPGIEKKGLPEITDYESLNVIFVTEKIFDSSFWKNSKHYFWAGRIADEIEKPRVSRRTLPLAVRYPLNIGQKVEIELPDAAR